MFNAAVIMLTKPLPLLLPGCGEHANPTFPFPFLLPGCREHAKQMLPFSLPFPLPLPGCREHANQLYARELESTGAATPAQALLSEH